MPAFPWQPLSWTSIRFLCGRTVRYAEGVHIGSKEARIVEDQQGQEELFRFEDVTSGNNGSGNDGWMDNDDSVALEELLSKNLCSPAVRVF